MIKADKAPGAQVPTEPIKKPPSTGVIMLVVLSRDVLRPRMPPISSGLTAFVKVLRKTVFSTLEVRESGIRTMSREIKFGATANKIKDRLIPTLASRIKLFSL